MRALLHYLSVAQHHDVIGAPGDESFREMERSVPRSQADGRTPGNLAAIEREAQRRESALREYEAEVHEGTGHHGRSALVGLVARKR